MNAQFWNCHWAGSACGRSRSWQVFRQRSEVTTGCKPLQSASKKDAWGRTRLELRLFVAKEAPATGRHMSSHIGSPSRCWESLEDNVSGSPGGAGRGMNIKLWHFRSSSQRETCIFKWTKGKSACRSQSWLVTRALRISESVSPDILIHKKGGKRELTYKWLVANLLPTLVISSRFKNWKMGCCLDPRLKRAICTFIGGAVSGPFGTRCGTCI